MARATAANRRRGAQRKSSRTGNGLRLLRNIVAALVLGAVPGLVAWQWDTLTQWPIRKVAIQGGMRYVAEAEIRQGLAPFTERGLLFLPLEEARASLRQLPWVDDVRLSRSWPDTVAVSVIEQQPVARWGDRSLLNNNGEVFTPPSIAEFGQLTWLYGPAGSEREVMSSYLALNKVLAQRGMQVLQLRRDAVGAWRAQLSDGLTLVFGRDDFAGRIRRFIAVYDRQLALYRDNLDTVDLRYRNGLAVAWKVPLDQWQPQQGS